MSLVRSVSIKTKLIGASVLAGVALLLVSAVAAVAIHQLDTQFADFSHVEFAAQAHLAALQLQMGNVRSNEKDALLNFDEAESGKRYKAQWQWALTAVRTELSAVRHSLSAADRQAVDAALRDYEALAGAVIQRGINGQIVTATEANQALEPARQRLRQTDPLLGGLAQRINVAARDRTNRVSEAAGARLTLIVSVAAGALALFCPAMWITMLSVTRPLDHAIRVADRIAQGDLGTPVPFRGRDEVSSLMRALSSMQGSLHEIVAQVRDATGSITTASAQITTGSHHLLTRTEQAAAHLRQTTSSLSELTQRVVEAEDAARSATDMSSTAAVSARQGGEEVTDVVGRMEKLASTSHQISEIIGLIDGIAFQTNLLALNAAVEAVLVRKAAASRWSRLK